MGSAVRVAYTSGSAMIAFMSVAGDVPGIAGFVYPEGNIEQAAAFERAGRRKVRPFF